MSTLKRKIKQISCPVAIFLMFLVISTLCHFRFLGENGEYSCAVTPQVRQTGNRLSGLAGTAYASLLA